MYLAKLCELIAEKYNNEYVWRAEEISDDTPNLHYIT